MSSEFGGYGSIEGQSGGNQDDTGAFGGYQSEDYVIFQSLSDTISSNIFQINSNVQALERICKQLGNQLKELPYDKLHHIQQGTNKLVSETTLSLKRMINLQGGTISEKETSARDKVLTESPKNGFIFSSPEAKSQRFSVKESLEMADNEVSFSFSDPVPVKKSSAASKETFFNPFLQSQKTSSSSKPMVNHSSKSTLSVNPFSNDIGTGQVPPAKTPGKPEPAQTIDLTKRFAPAPSSWECGSCMLNNKPDAIKCVACKAPKPGKKTEKLGEDKHVIDWKTKFAPPKDSWECSTCLIRNKNDLSNCAACETPKPGASSIVDLKTKFAPPVGSWECSTCMIQNKAGDLKCVACETPKPGTSSIADLKIKFAPPVGSWECSTCMIQNKAGDLKCVACETKKPGSSSGDDLKLKFAPPSGSWACPTCMIQNKAADLKCAACETKKPGSPKFAPPVGSWKCSTCMIQNKAGDLKCATSLFSFTGSNPTPLAATTTTPAPNKAPFSFTASKIATTLPNIAQPSAAPVVENQNSMGGEEMDVDSNNNYDQATFPQVSGGFNFTPQQPGGTSNLFSAGSSGTPGGVSGGFNFNASSGIAPTFQFGTGNPSTPFGVIPTMFNIGIQSTTPGNRFIRKAVRRTRK